MASGLRSYRRRSLSVPAKATVLWVAWQALPLLLLAACSTPRNELAAPAARSSVASGTSTSVYVVRRAWHVDIGLVAQDLRPPLASLREDFPGAQYLRFGFGDRHYLLARGRGLALLAALWPGPGILLVTGLPAAPDLANGAEQVIRIELTPEQTDTLQAFVWNSLTTHAGKAMPVEAGPYAGSLYYNTPQRYSAFHTCNTWAAEALKSAKLPIRSAGVKLAGQLWRQVQQLPQAPGETPEAMDLIVCRPDTPPSSLQGERRPRPWRGADCCC